MTDSDFAELRALWDAASIEVKMAAPQLTGVQAILFDVEYEQVALVYDAGHNPGTTEGAMANARLIAWLLDHSWSLVYDDSDAARREVVAAARALNAHDAEDDEREVLSPCLERETLMNALARLDAEEAEDRRQGRKP